MQFVLKIVFEMLWIIYAVSLERWFFLESCFHCCVLQLKLLIQRLSRSRHLYCTRQPHFLHWHFLNGSTWQEKKRKKRKLEEISTEVHLIFQSWLIILSFSGVKSTVLPSDCVHVFFFSFLYNHDLDKDSPHCVSHQSRNPVSLISQTISSECELCGL